MRNILITDASFYNSSTIPGVLFGDPKNPIQNVTFTNVRNFGNFEISPNYFCKNVQNMQAIDVIPKPDCAN